MHNDDVTLLAVEKNNTPLETIFNAKAKYAQICIEGHPAPQGSMKHIGRGRLVPTSQRLVVWRKIMTAAARDALPRGWYPISSPISVEMCFYLPKGKSVRRAVPTTPPDLDKLIRAVGDSFTNAGVWKDDSFIVKLEAKKNYPPSDGWQGVVVTFTWD